MNHLSKNRQSGFSLVAAIFLLIVLGALGTYMVTISTVQQQTLSYSFLSSRAYQAARSGIEWGIYRALNDGNCSSFPPGSPKVINFSDGSLSGFQASISCTLTTHQEKSNSFNVYSLRAESETDSATFGSLDYVAREIAVTITDATP
ncbi:MAG: pilus assembly protein MshP [Gammaproteobacteria bacterium]|nr:pilus assembly protein MshP [Gammaproteobacteria bacterium]MCP3853095.1 pilus assembly protein MshP [Gammaproteobacteria bacterium]